MAIPAEVSLSQHALHHQAESPPRDSAAAMPIQRAARPDFPYLHSMMCSACDDLVCMRHIRGIARLGIEAAG